MIGQERVKIILEVTELILVFGHFLLSFEKSNNCHNNNITLIKHSFDELERLLYQINNYYFRQGGYVFWQGLFVFFLLAT